MKPALTADRWDRYARKGEADSLFFAQRVGDVPILTQEWRNPHAVAALLLRGQPFGFTREDVLRVRASGNELTKWAFDAETDEERVQMVKAGFALIDLAGRIEALLPNPLGVPEFPASSAACSAGDCFYEPTYHYCDGHNSQLGARIIQLEVENERLRRENA